MELPNLLSNITFKELIPLPDLKSNDIIEKGPFDIQFYRESFGSAMFRIGNFYIILVCYRNDFYAFHFFFSYLCVVVEAGGIVEMGVHVDLEILNSYVGVSNKNIC